MTALPPLVGLIGKKRVGKDTFASVLVEEFSFARVAFADPLKEMALTIDPIIDGEIIGGIVSDPIYLSTEVASLGWEEVKDDFPEARRFLQRLGDGVRQFDPEFWLNAGMARTRFLRGGTVVGDWTHIERGVGMNDSSQPVVITDVRYPNEADAIRDAGGILVRVVRPGVDDGDTHASETALDGYEVDLTVVNVFDTAAGWRDEAGAIYTDHITRFI